MKLKGMMELERMEDNQEEKLASVCLGTVRCPRCHRDGRLVIWISALKGKYPEVMTWIEHEGRYCNLALEVDHFVMETNPKIKYDWARVIPKVIFSE